MSNKSSSLSEVAPNFDKWTAIFGGSLFILLAIFTLLPFAATVYPFIPVFERIGPGSLAIAWITGVTAFTAVYRLRRPQPQQDNRRIPAVRQSFFPTESGENTDFGLKDFCPGAALYLQILVIGAETEDIYFRLTPLDSPLHLAEGESIGFVHDDTGASCNEFPKDVAGKSSQNSKDEMIHLPYSYVATSGEREPAGVGSV